MFVSTTGPEKTDVSGPATCKTVTPFHHTRTQQKGILILTFTHGMVSRMSIKCVCKFEVKHSEILHINFTVASWHCFKTTLL